MTDIHQTTDIRQDDVVLRTLRRTRQIREFTDESVDDAEIQAILEVARWTGSGANRQPWTFVIVRDPAERQRIAELAPHASHVAQAPVAIAIVMDGSTPKWDDYDEGRAAERILIAATDSVWVAASGWRTDLSAPRSVRSLTCDSRHTSGR